MKKHYLRFATLILFVLAFSFGCKKENIISESQSNEMNTLARTSSENYECNFSLDEYQIDSIGTEHNRLVKVAFNHYIKNSEISIFSALNQAFENNNYPTLSEEEFAEFEEKYSEQNVQSTVEYIIDTMSNTIQKQIFNDMVNAVIDNTSDYETLLQTLNSLKEYTRENLTCSEQLSTLVALEVCINSAKLWMSTEAGGEGYLDYISNGGTGRTSLNNRASGFWSWNTVGVCVIGDAVGAFNGFCQGAMPYLLMGGAANPIGNALLAAHTIRGAVAGSVMAAVGRAVR